MTIHQAAASLTPSTLSSDEAIADFVGAVIWAMVRPATEKEERALFLLAGLPAAYLAGLSRTAPSTGHFTLAIDPTIDPGLLGCLSPDHLSHLPAVRRRNLDANGAVLIAARDEERDSVGQSLGVVERLDQEGIQAKHDLWAEAILNASGVQPSDSATRFVEAMVAGLDRSKVARSLDQFARVIAAFISARGLPLSERLRRTTIELRLPGNCFKAMPKAESGAAVSTEDFRAMFAAADRDHRDLPYLRGSDQKRLDVDAIRARVIELRALSSTPTLGAPPSSALDAVDALLDDLIELRAGEWRPSQARFCEEFDFGLHGKAVFQQKAKRQASGLGERTKRYIEKEHSDFIDDDDRKVLDGMEAEAKPAGGSAQKGEDKVATDDAVRELFERRHDLIIQNTRLFSEWRERVIPALVDDEPDLLLALLKGSQLAIERAVIDGRAIPAGTRLLIGAKSAKRESTWVGLDERVYALFRQEMRLIAGALGDLVDLDLGLWLDPDSVKGAKKSDRADARTIELEVSALVPGSSEPGPKVRVNWSPCPTAKRSIALAFPEDVIAILAGCDQGLIRLQAERIHPQSAGDDATMTLVNTASFGDVARGLDGRTAAPAAGANDTEWFGVLDRRLDELERGHALPADDRVAVAAAASFFRLAMTEALLAVRDDPASCYATGAIPRAATAFGELCRVARERLSSPDEVRTTALRQVCEFGLATSSSANPVAIVPAWHPLRLLERQGRAAAVSSLLRDACADGAVTPEGLRGEVADYARALADWHYAQVVSVGLVPYACIETFGGYGLAVSLDRASRATQALEASAKPARDQFMKISKEYLGLHPHEEGNFTTAIYNAESVELPRLLAEALEDLMDDRADLRCGMLITHDEADRVRHIFAHQNTRLQGRDTRSDGAFLSRLRVGVRKGAGSRPASRRPDNDVAFLHDVFARQSEVRWRMEAGPSEELPVEASLRAALRPRRRLTNLPGAPSKRLSVHLQLDRLPRAVAQFTDLCYAADEQFRNIPPGQRATPVREVSWGGSDPKVARIVEHAHDLAEWVVSYDSLSSRAMLADAGIRVIRDVAIPGSEARLLVSSREPSRNLRRVLVGTFAAMAPPALSGQADDLARRVLSSVVEICGQKVMAASRSVNAALEILGLAAATSLVRFAPETKGKPLVWLSLDDSRAALDLKGDLADTLAVAVVQAADGTFHVDLTVVEAKCVSQPSIPEIRKKSAAQTKATCGALASRLVDQSDPAAARSWGGRILRLLVSKPEFATVLPAEQMGAFMTALLDGKARFSVRGRSVIVCHDDETSSPTMAFDVVSEAPTVVQHTFGQQALAMLMAVDGGPDGGLPIPPVGPEPEPSNEGPLIPQQSLDPASDPSSLRANHMAPGVGRIGTEEDSRTTDGASAGPMPAPALPVEGESATKQVHDAPAHSPPLHATFGPALTNLLDEIAGRKAGSSTADDDRIKAEKVAVKLQGALAAFGMKAIFANDPITPTPNGVIVRFRGDDLLTLKRIEARRSELRTTHGLDVVRIMEGLGEIGIFVAASPRRVVDLARTWLEATWPASAPEAMTSFLVGVREDNGAPLWLNLDAPFGGNESHAPHTLIAGETGSGKGVLTQNLLLQMVALNDPRNLSLRLIDPKQGVDYFWIADAPHLQGGIVSTQEEAGLLLADLVEEMERRYGLLVARKATNLAEYNAEVDPTERLPRIVLIHDEMANWMTESEDYRDMIVRTMTSLAVKARAAGINIILITQRAAQDAIPVGIRDNLGNRLCLKVASEAGSKLALKGPGAERLLGKGHVAADLSGDRPMDSDFFLAQTPFASTSDLKRLGPAAVACWQRPPDV